MTWSYQDPTQSSKDAVRFTIGDTVSTDPLLSDEEINFLLTDSAVDEASYYGALAIAAKFSRSVDKSVGKIRISNSQKTKQYQDLAKELWLKMGILAVPTAGGLYESEKLIALNDGTVSVDFKRGMMTNGSSVNNFRVI